VKLRPMATAIVFGLCGIISSASYANTLLPDDSTKITALHKRVSDFTVSLGQIQTSMVRSNGISKEMFCLMRIEDQANNINLYLYGTTFLVDLASKMTDPTDEMWLLVDASVALSSLSNALGTARSEINRVIGGCQGRLAYDQAKSLLGLTDEARSITMPMLTRVRAALPVGIGR